MATVTLKARALKQGRNSATLANDWNDLITVINALVTIVTELKADHATVITELTAIGTTLADVKSQFDAHTHTYANDSGTQTSGPDSTAEGFSPATGAVTITDTSGSSVPATLSAATPDTLALVN